MNMLFFLIIFFTKDFFQDEGETENQQQLNHETMYCSIWHTDHIHLAGPSFLGLQTATPSTVPLNFFIQSEYMSRVNKIYSDVSNQIFDH